MKVVLDTNILVGACLGSYHANRLIKACLTGEFIPTEYEAKKRFENRAKQGDVKRALELLDKAL